MNLSFVLIRGIIAGRRADIYVVIMRCFIIATVIAPMKQVAAPKAPPPGAHQKVSPTNSSLLRHNLSAFAGSSA